MSTTTRVIKLKLLTQTDLVKVETSARTLGELKSESIVKGLNIDWASAKLIDRASKASFDLDEAILPAIDALMFVTPTKTKSGADLPYKEVKAKIKEYKDKGGIVNFNYTQATTSELNTFWNTISTTKPSVTEVKKVVESVKTNSEEVKELSKLEKLEAKFDALMSKFSGTSEEKVAKEVVKEVPKEDTILVKDIAEVITKSELNSEANYLKNKFYK